MNLTAVNNTVTMSSLEIAELTNKDHKHVIRDIRAMLKCIPDGPDLDHVQEEKDIRGYTSKISLNYNLTMALITGYSIELRHKVINRWQKLEQEISKSSLPDFTNPVIAC